MLLSNNVLANFPEYVLTRGAFAFVAFAGDLWRGGFAFVDGGAEDGARQLVRIADTATAIPAIFRPVAEFRDLVRVYDGNGKRAQLRAPGIIQVFQAGHVFLLVVEDIAAAAVRFYRKPRAETPAPYRAARPDA